MGVSKNSGTPKTPKNDKMIIFSRKTPWLLGKPTIFGNIHIYIYIPRGAGFLPPKSSSKLLGPGDAKDEITNKSPEI